MDSGAVPMGSGGAQQADKATGRASSSPGLSSPPNSPPSNTDAKFGRNQQSFGVANHDAAAPATSSKNSTAAPQQSNTSTPTAPPPKGKPGRKKKDPNAVPVADEKPKEKATRKTRVAKDKEPGKVPTTRKRKQPPSEATFDEKAPPARQPKITDQQFGMGMGTMTVNPQMPHPASPSDSMPTHGLKSHVPTHLTPGPHTTTPSGPPTPRPASSGQHFDPIRSTNIISPISSSVPAASLSKHPGMMIGTLIDPTGGATATSKFSTAPSQLNALTSAAGTPGSVSPSSAHQQPSFAIHSNAAMQSNRATPTSNGPTSMAMDIDKMDDSKPSGASRLSDVGSNGAGDHSTPAATPPTKAPRNKEPPPPLPTGSGLLSGMAFGGPTSAPSDPSKMLAANIHLTFPIRGQNNVTINFAREVEKKYGFAALHPRIAARDQKRKQLAAAAAALEKTAGTGTGSADDMSVESDAESNPENGGADENASSATGDKPLKKARKARGEEYDRNDDFIDDTELAWEEQALMAKDGFFVYSGPLITEGERPPVERSDGTVKRGRGRGRGGSTRGDGTGRGRGRGGGGPGSRGGTTVRKPRVTKADRAQMEQEKMERERVAQTLAAKTPMAQYSGTMAA
ncbi:hypothetical protein K402DRAFT_411658 [Aulographum hederae CBS 113979]|uniref:Hpc2-related domain-containing protein n=1 Tax=Aulographum hederae CBS 113979 TaxID=1176131 RepID=A0A6G1H5F0_9PEZI|nr:hypothetical protein K402DRAFT_411658 [Aulographum hederae CBS 113979]